jgi:GNAT superfamily N-acetyltransferase
VDLSWIDAADPDQHDLAGAVAVLEAARAVSTLEQPPTTVSNLTAVLRHGWDGEPPATAVTRAAGRRVVGVLQVELPRWDNPKLGYVDVTVDPVRRREGIGRVLFQMGADRVRGAGRTLVATQSDDTSAATGFATFLGLRRGSEEVQRRQDLTTLDPRRLQHLQAQAEPNASAYELVRLPAWTPDDSLEQVARLTDAINDAPTDDLDIEDEVHTPARVRAFETAQLAQGRRMYRLAARDRRTGALVGQTLVGVEVERPGQAWQYDTSVCREHRGHRLGLLLKLEMLRWLGEREPQLRVLDTFNAASNDHMVAVNDALGYQALARMVIWQRRC